MEHSIASPSVSVIVPVYKTEAYLTRCVNSILAQSCSDYELLLVDDGSPDNCPDMCDIFAAEHKAIRSIHKENGGLSSARLAGFREAKGEYILFVDSDDYIHPQMLEKLLLAMQTEQADLAICGYYKENGLQKYPQFLPLQTNVLDGKDVLTDKYVLPILGHDPSTINLPGFLCLRMMKRKLIEPAFFVSEREYFLEDHVFDLLYADRISRIAIVNEPLYHYCFNSASLSNSYRKGKWQMYQRLLEFYQDYIQKRNIQGTHKRINGFLLSAFQASVDNAVLSGSYKSYQNELNELLSSKEMPAILRAAHEEHGSTTLRITLMLIQAHAYRMLYLLRKARMRRNSA